MANSSRRSRVVARVEYKNVPNDRGSTQPGVEVQCKDCDLIQQCFGQHERSLKRALLMLNQKCPRKQDNFYITEEQDEEDNEDDSFEGGE